MAFRLTVDGEAYEIVVVRRRPHLVVRIDGREHEVTAAGEPGEGRQSIEVAGHSAHFTRAHAGDRQIVRLHGRTYEIGIVDPRAAEGGSGSGQDIVKAPMPGAVVSVHKAEGDPVKRGETIVTIESMKLQTALVAPRDGVIAAILRKDGETFEKDEVIARLVDTGEPA